MIKVYMVFINCGFGGVKYFQNPEKAAKFAEEIGEKVEPELATPQEWISLDFCD